MSTERATEQYVDAFIKAQSVMNATIATMIAERTGWLPREVIARTTELGVRYTRSSKNNPADPSVFINLAEMDQEEKKSVSPTLLFGLIVALGFTVYGGFKYSGQPSSDRDSGEVSADSSTARGMTSDQRSRYDALPPEGKAHVDRQMKAYDRLCDKGVIC